LFFRNARKPPVRGIAMISAIRYALNQIIHPRYRSAFLDRGQAIVATT